MQKEDSATADNGSESKEEEEEELPHIPTAQEVLEMMDGKDALWKRVAKAMVQPKALTLLHRGIGIELDGVHEDDPCLDAVQEHLWNAGYDCVHNVEHNTLYIDINMWVLRKYRKALRARDPAE